MSKEIIIDLTENLANVGKCICFEGEFVPEYDLLPYPNATITNVTVNLDVTFCDSSVEIGGTITCFVEGSCDRCLTQVVKQIELPFEQVFYKDEAEEDEYVYTNSLLNVTKAVCDEVILSAPSLFLCKDDCKGLCPKCGVNLNEVVCSCNKVKDNVFSILKNLKF